ncbi:hypothetical protein [Spirosoma areae]
MPTLITGRVRQIDQFNDDDSRLANVEVTLRSAENLLDPVVVTTDEFGLYATNYFTIPIDIAPYRDWIDLIVNYSKTGYVSQEARVRVYYNNPTIPRRYMVMRLSRLTETTMFRRAFLKKMEIFDDTDYFGAGEIWVRAWLHGFGSLSAPYQSRRQSTLVKESGQFVLDSGSTRTFTRSTSPISFTIRRPFFQRGIRISAIVREDDKEGDEIFNPLDATDPDDFDTLLSISGSGITDTSSSEFVLSTDTCRLTFGLLMD